MGPFNSCFILRFALNSITAKRIARASSLLVLCAVCGCVNPAFAAKPVSTLTASSRSVSFGGVVAGQTATESITLSSTGTSAVTISSLSINGSLFTATGITTPYTLAPGKSVPLTLQFYSAHVSSFTGTLTIASNSSGGNITVAMSGTGLSPLSGLSCAQSTLIGSASDTCTVSLSAPAPTGGLLVTLGSNSAALAVPASITVPAGSKSSSFTATPSAVTSAQSASITASALTGTSSFTVQLSPGTPTLSVSSTSVNFGNVVSGQTAMRSITFSSTGNQPVTISSLSIAGSLFTASGVTTPLTLNPGQSAQLTLSFDSIHVSSFTGALTIASNSSAGNVTVNMSGSGISPLSSLTCAQAAIAGSTTDTCTVSLAAPAPTGGLPVTMVSSNSALTVPTSITVPAGAGSASFTATATAVTSAQSASLTASALLGSNSFTVQLNVATPTLSVSSTAVNFGNITSGQTATHSITLSSTGNQPVTISSLAIVGSLFTSSGITTPLTLNPGQSATLTLQFYAQHVSSFTGVLTIASNSSTGNITVNLSGTGVAAPGVLSALSCTNSTFAGSGTDACTVALNAAAGSSGLVVNLSSNDSVVTVPASVTVPSGASTASFSASVSAVTSAQTATLSASSSGISETFAVQLAPATSILTINSTSISFGNVVINTPATQILTLKSTGTTAVTVNAANISGAGFSVSGQTFPLTLNAGQSVTLNVQFDPGTAGAASGTLTISSNASGNGTAVVNLSGTGLPHEINLSWNAPGGSDPIAGYNVYRAASGSTSYQRLNPALNAPTSYTDMTAQSGVSYEYYVTSVDQSGKESTPSNYASVSVP